MDRQGRTPGGVVGAWWNVVVCGVIAVGSLVSALTAGHGSERLFFGIGVFVITAALEVVFVRNLRQQMARRRGE
ncbi:hypothetical protein ASF23_11775 [Curtobacterium sp. Leaf261]|nr:hypothetical protein ASF23_11775 [Curtobacterium sp. Leaf261]